MATTADAARCLIDSIGPVPATVSQTTGTVTSSASANST